MKTYILHWLDDTTEEIEGNNISDAFTRAGYSAGALRALDYYEEIKDTRKYKTNRVLL